MTTLVEPKINIDKFWTSSIEIESQDFRLMKYVIRVDHIGKVLLHNVVTGQLVILDQEEADLLDCLPKPYSAIMDKLVKGLYLVPINFDEHQKVSGLRNLLRKMEDAKAIPGIRNYTILPTTACNARCYYCYEKGIEAVTMSEQMADDVVKFIASNCEGQNVQIDWFGGEPTVAANRIEQICEGLHREKVTFSSKMTTNGYLFDEEMVQQAKSAWNLKSVMICVDGVEEHYNSIKAFAGVRDNPYQRVMRNIGLLLDQDIQVSLRMNFDKNNHEEFSALLDDAESRFHRNPLLNVYAHQIIGDYSSIGEGFTHGSETWFQEKICEMNGLSCQRGLLHRRGMLPQLNYSLCRAADEHSVTILPQGTLVSCPEQLGNDQIKGSIQEGLSNYDMVKSWKRFDDLEMCRDCELFPVCTKIANCKGKNCYVKKDRLRYYVNLIHDFVS